MLKTALSHNSYVLTFSSSGGSGLYKCYFLVYHKVNANSNQKILGNGQMTKLIPTYITASGYGKCRLLTGYGFIDIYRVSSLHKY